MRKKIEAMRRIIVFQSGTIKEQNEKIKSLTDENQFLKIQHEKVYRFIEQYEDIVDSMICQNDKHIKVSKDIKRMNKMLKKIRKFIRWDNE